MNNNTIAYPKQSLPSADVNLGSTSTSEKAFITSATVSALNPVASAPIVLPLPSDGQIDGTAASSGFNSAFSSGNQGSAFRCRKFRLVAFGRVITSGTLNFTVDIQYGTSATVASNTDIATSGAVSLASLTTHWFMECHFIHDAASQRLDGFFMGQVHTTRVAPTTLTNPVTSVNLNNAGQTLGFVVTATFGTGAAGNFAYLDGFYLLID